MRTKRPSRLIAFAQHFALAWEPVVVRLTRSVVPLMRSRTNASEWSLVSPGTRLSARELKATNRPSALIAPASLREDFALA